VAVARKSANAAVGERIFIVRKLSEAPAQLRADGASHTGFPQQGVG